MVADVIVTGYAVRFPLVGMVLAFAHYVAGLERLGHRVFYLEESGWEQACYDPTTGDYGDDPTYGMGVMRRVLDHLGAPSTPIWYFDRKTVTWFGTGRNEVLGAFDGCDLLLNLGGVCQLDEFERCRRTALVDMDPGFTQAGRFGAPHLRSYDRLFTYGTNIGNPDCLIPHLEGLQWTPTVPPVIVDHWSPLTTGVNPLLDGGFTTVANLDAYGTIEVDGRTYGQKAPELDRLGDLAGRFRAAGNKSTYLELALAGGDAAAAERLKADGWVIVDAQETSLLLDRYERHITSSVGEFSVAKQAYVGLRTGWVSDRSVCYLASGRPVVVQDTGFDRDRFPGPDGGLLTWRTGDDALGQLLDVMNDYQRHQAAAQQWASDVFSHRVVLPELLSVGLADH